MPALDGLRGLAVAGVLLFHGGSSWAGGGFLGVSTFFTLSGFLITSLLLVEAETAGSVSLVRFWSRRARRLLPALLVAIAGILVFGVVLAGGHQAARLPGDAVSALLYSANWRFVIGDQSYASLLADPSPLQHFWSLAIEEQYYLVFPLLVAGVIACTRRVANLRHALGTVLVALAAASVLASLLLANPGAEPSRVYYGTDTRAAEMLLGGLLACLMGGRPVMLTRRGRRRLASVGAAALGLLLAGWLVVDLHSAFLYRGGLAGYGILTATVIAAAHVRGPVRDLLAWRPLRALGLISYGVYLYHWPIYLWLTRERTGLDDPALLAVRLGLTFAVAVASYVLVEQPIRTGRRWRTRPAALLAPAGVAALVVVALTAPIGSAQPQVVFAPVRSAHEVTKAASPPNPARVLPQTGPAAAPQPAAVPTPAPAPLAPEPPVQRIMVVGDSVGMTLGRGMERWGSGHGIRVLNAARFWCAIARGGASAAQLGKRSSPACDRWPQQWAADIGWFRPDVVVVLSTVWDVAEHRRDEWGPDFLGPGDPRFDSWVIGEWRLAVQVLSSRGARVVWLTDPCARDTGVDEHLQYANLHYVGTLGWDHVAIADLDAHVCPDGTFTDTIDGVSGARPDGLHFSDRGADAVARWLGPLLAAR